VVEEKEKEGENLLYIGTVEEMVSRKFHKYLKMYEKKDLNRMLTKKLCNYAIDLREEFILKNGKYKIERENVQKFLKDQLKKRYI